MHRREIRHSREHTSTTGILQTDGSPDTAPHSDSLCSQSANRSLLCLSVCLSVSFPPPPTHRPTHSRHHRAHTQNPTQSTQRETADRHNKYATRPLTHTDTDRQTDRQTDREGVRRLIGRSSASHTHMDPQTHTHTQTSSTQRQRGRGPSPHSTAASSPQGGQAISHPARQSHLHTDRQTDICVCRHSTECQCVLSVCCRSAHHRTARPLCTPPMGTAHRLNTLTHTDIRQTDIRVPPFSYQSIDPFTSPLCLSVCLSVCLCGAYRCCPSQTERPCRTAAPPEAVRSPGSQSLSTDTHTAAISLSPLSQSAGRRPSPPTASLSVCVWGSSADERFAVD